MRLISLLTFLILFMLATIPAPAPAFDLTIVHLNDTHSYLDASTETLRPGSEKTYVKLGGWAGLTSAIKTLRASRKNMALLHAGDAVQGGLYFLKYSGKPEIDFMNRLGFDAMTLGNHDFDKGASSLAKMLAPAQFPILSANLEATSQPQLAAKVKPFTILTFGKERVGIVGLTTPDTQNISVGGKDVRFLDATRTAQKQVRKLAAMGINKIILLTHMGYEMDKKLATQVPGVDVIVGGHSHTLLGNERALGALGLKPEGPYPTLVRGTDGSDVLVVTAWKWGRMLPTLDLSFNDSGRIIRAKGNAPLMLADTFKRKNAKGEKVELKGAERNALLKLIAKNPAAEVVQPDADAVKFLKPYSEGVASLSKQIIGSAMTDLPHVRVPDAKHPQGSLLAPLVAESMLWQTTRMDEAHDSWANMALVNAGGIRDSIFEGPITVGSALTIMPFGNTLYTLRLSGEQIHTALEHGVDTADGAFPYVAGARYTADMTKPKGKRIAQVELLNEEKEWETLNPNKIYKVITNAFLAHGGDGYDMLPPAMTTGEDTGFVDSQVFMDYVQHQKELTAPAETGVTMERKMVE